MRAKLSQIKEMSKTLKAIASGCPAKCLPEPVVEALQVLLPLPSPRVLMRVPVGAYAPPILSFVLQELGEACGDGRRPSLIRRMSNPNPVLQHSAMEAMPDDQARALLAPCSQGLVIVMCPLWRSHGDVSPLVRRRPSTSRR